MERNTKIRYCGSCGNKQKIDNDLTVWNCNNCGEWNIKEKR